MLLLRGNGMFLTNIFGLKKKCNHTKVAPNLDFAYCPDCGKAVKARTCHTH